MADEFSVYDTYNILNRQLNSFWDTDLPDNFMTMVEKAIIKTKDGWDGSTRMYYKRRGFSVLNSSLYAVFLYYLSHSIGIRGGEQLADKLYYLNKIMNSVEWYWNIELPNHFITEHPIGSVLGKGRYGDYFSIYQGATVGESLNRDEVEWPVLGHHVTMFANASVIGRCNIGNWVVLSSDTKIKNQDIPDCSIVFGKSPNLIIKKYEKNDIQDYYIKSWDMGGAKYE